MKRAMSVISTCAVLLGAVLAAQAKPTFSGTWKLVPDAAATGGGQMFVVSELDAVQDAKTLVVTSTSDQMGQSKTTYNLDGTEAQSPLEFNGTSIDRVTKAAWDGDKLVLTTKSDFNGQAFEVKQVWSLADDGSLVVEMTLPDFQGGGAPTTTKSTYKKS